MLKLNNVSSGYKNKNVLFDVNFEIHRGEILALVGLNGSGKSTLLKTILGLLKAATGAIHFDGRELSSYTLLERAQKLSLLESQVPLAFPCTVEELVALPSQEKVTEALRTAGMENLRHRNVLELSNGELRRALIAHTLASNPEVILLDEPFAHLDWSHQHDLAHGLRQWKREHGTTFVVAIHELEWAVKFADRVCVLHQGRVIKLDIPENVFNDTRVCEVFAFEGTIDENPIDGSRRLTLGRK